MAYKNREFIDPTKRGRGRLWISEAVAPAEKIQPDDSLPTLLVDPVHDEFFEAVMLKGTIISVYEAPAGSGAEDEGITYVAGPCDGTTTGLKAIPQGVLMQDAYRPFENSENEGVSFIVQGYVEWPLVRKSTGETQTQTFTDTATDTLTITDADFFGPVTGVTKNGTPLVAGDANGYTVAGKVVTLAGTAVGNGTTDDFVVTFVAESFDNTDLTVGDFVKPDALGRPVKWVAGTDAESLKVGRVLMKESLVDNDFDYGFLQYMQLPVTEFEEAMLRTIYESNVDGVGPVFGVRPNVDALLTLNEAGANAGAVVAGCVRVVLSL